MRFDIAEEMQRVTKAYLEANDIKPEKPLTGDERADSEFPIIEEDNND